MDLQQLKALDKSIEKWVRIDLVLYTTDPTKALIEDGAHDCECCIQFRKWDGCLRCPIAIYTGESYCSKTPYVSWLNVYKDYYGVYPYLLNQRGNNQDRRNLVLLRSFAKQELDFLRKIRSLFIGE